jgi:hypothetical protein
MAAFDAEGSAMRASGTADSLSANLYHNLSYPIDSNRLHTPILLPGGRLAVPSGLCTVGYRASPLYSTILM